MSRKQQVAHRIYDDASRLIQEADAAGLFKLSYMLEKAAIEAARNIHGTTGAAVETMLLH